MSFLAALAILLYAAIVLAAGSPVGFVVLLLGLYVLLLSISYEAVVYSACLLSWLLTLGE